MPIGLNEFLTNSIIKNKRTVGSGIEPLTL